MGKPQIIRFEHDPESPWPEDASFYWGTGTETGREEFARGGYPPVEITDDNRVSVWRSFGFRPIYAPRNFHATPANGEYRVSCRMCGKSTLSGLPHDTAERHVVNGCCYVP